MSTSPSRKSTIFNRAAIALVFLLYIPYATVLLLRSSFLLDGKKYFVLFDDMMISMRYAKNLANGYGLVWNPGGERVEGITNLLWTVYMSFFHHFPIPTEKMSLPIQITGIICMLGTVWFVKKLSDALALHSFATITALVLTAFYYPLTNWSVILGTEVSILTTLVTACSFLAIKSLQKKQVSYLFLFLLGFMTLIRIDMTLFSGVLIVLLSLLDQKNMKRYLILGLGSIGICFFGQTAWRYWYYGDFLPNTYYVKVAGFPAEYRISRGALVAWEFIKQTNPLLFFLPLLTLVQKIKREYVLLLSIIGIQFLYSIYVGGDVWEYFGGSNRYTSLIMPIYFILFTNGFLLLIKQFKIMSNSSLVPLWSIFLLLSLISFNTVNQDMTDHWLLHEQPLTTVGGNIINVKRSLMINAITNNGATVAVIWAGTMPYFSDRTFIDFYGKNDKVIAHVPMQIYPPTTELPKKLTAFLPGHMKWDYSYSIGRLKPDIITQVYPYERAKKYIEKDYIKVDFGEFYFYLRKDSKNINWNRIKTH